jgi:hypothetical protein
MLVQFVFHGTLHVKNVGRCVLVDRNGAASNGNHILRPWKLPLAVKQVSPCDRRSERPDGPALRPSIQAKCCICPPMSASGKLHCGIESLRERQLRAGSSPYQLALNRNLSDQALNRFAIGALAAGVALSRDLFRVLCCWVCAVG